MNKFDENVLCISSEDLWSVDWKWNWLKTEKLDEYISLFNQKWIFIRRWDVEEDINFKQIIPQIILKYNKNWEDTYFLHKQNSKISEERLVDMYPLFLGGHIEEIDGMVWDKQLIQNATNRELEEEVMLKSNIINKDFKWIVYIEDGNFVNHVHIWLIWIYELDGENVEINEDKLEKVWFVNKDFLLQKKDKMTYWSQLCVDFLN